MTLGLRRKTFKSATIRWDGRYRWARKSAQLRRSANLRVSTKCRLVVSGLEEAGRYRRLISMVISIEDIGFPMVRLVRKIVCGWTKRIRVGDVDIGRLIVGNLIIGRIHWYVFRC